MRTKGWQTKSIGELCELIGGGTPAKNNSAFYGGNIPWASIRDIQSDILTSTEFSITEDAVRASSTNIIPRGNVVMACRVGLGKVCIVDQDTAINQDLRAVIPRKSNEIERRFLLRWLQSKAEDIQAAGKGATVKGVTVPFIAGMRIPLPPLPDQQRIVDLLDEAFAALATAKANTEKNLQNARALFESHLDAHVGRGKKGWIESTIGTCTRFIDYRGKTPKKTTSGLRLITAKNVKIGYLQETPLEFVAPDSYDAWMTRGIPKFGDVLFTTEAPLANVAQLDTTDKVVFAQRIIIMQADPSQLDSTFLKYLLLSETVQQRILGKGTGATVQGIKASLLKTIKISFPRTTETQRKLVSQLGSLSAETQRLASLYRQKLTALDALKKSLLHHAFTGQL
ncbi:MAG TPA: restriction endonuclease subunit S [Phycisphaerae bacterium]|nr:restriction endonuclease subunit S [Phycisphaerae bacterium]